MQVEIRARISSSYRVASGAEDGVGQDARFTSPLLREIKSRNVLWKASKELAARTPPPQGDATGFGIVLASCQVNIGACELMREEYGRRLSEGPGEGHDDASVLLANLPEGADLRALGDLWKARGPQLNLYDADFDTALEVGELLIGAGQAERLLICAIETLADGSVAADMAIVDGNVTGQHEGSAYLGTGATFSRNGEEAAGTLAERALGAFVDRSAIAPQSTALVCATYAGTLAEQALASLVGVEGPREFGAVVADFARRRRFKRSYTLGGFAGAGIGALSIARALVVSGDVDRAVVCCTDVVGNGVDEALRLIGCEDRAGLGEGCGCVLIEPRGAGSDELRTAQFGPMIRFEEPVSIGHHEPAIKTLKARPVAEVVVSGCGYVDLAAGSDVARQLWPAAAVTEKSAGRMVAADAVTELTRSPGPRAVMCASLMGGSGVVVRG